MLGRMTLDTTLGMIGCICAGISLSCVFVALLLSLFAGCGCGGIEAAEVDAGTASTCVASELVPEGSDMRGYVFTRVGGALRQCPLDHGEVCARDSDAGREYDCCAVACGDVGR
jgi:hypothetical protein